MRSSPGSFQKGKTPFLSGDEALEAHREPHGVDTAEEARLLQTEE